MRHGCIKYWKSNESIFFKNDIFTKGFVRPFLARKINQTFFISLLTFISWTFPFFFRPAILSSSPILSTFRHTKKDTDYPKRINAFLPNLLADICLNFSFNLRWNKNNVFQNLLSEKNLYHSYHSSIYRICQSFKHYI